MKTIEEFIDLFINQFDDIDKNELSATTHFRDLDDWSSLIGLSVMVMVSEEFGVNLSPDDIRKSNTPEDIYNIILAKSKL